MTLTEGIRPREHTKCYVILRYTPHRSVQVLGFDFFAAPRIRFLFVRPALFLGLPSDPQSPGKPLLLANTPPCRVCRRL